RPRRSEHSFEPSALRSLYVVDLIQELQWVERMHVALYDGRSSCTIQPSTVFLRPLHAGKIVFVKLSDCVRELVLSCPAAVAPHQNRCMLQLHLCATEVTHVSSCRRGFARKPGSRALSLVRLRWRPLLNSRAARLSSLQERQDIARD